VTARRRPLLTLAVCATGAALLVVLIVVALVLLPWTLAFDRDRRVVARVGSALARAAARIPRRWRPILRSVGLVDLRRPAVVVMNHRSVADVGIAVALPGGPPIVAKPWVARVPVLGAAMRLSGHLVFDPADVGEVRDLLDRAEGLLRRGVPVVFFPEGTRRAEEGLGAFDEGAFAVAVRAGADVLPVVLTGTGDLVPRGSFAFTDAPFTVTPLDRIPPGTDRGALCRRVRAAMLSQLERSPAP
jgi:1-acyl-sn-glycerol-3-phosphate acyltransferase